MEESSDQLKDEIAVLGMHIRQYVVEDHRPWAEVGRESRVRRKTFCRALMKLLSHVRKHTAKVGGGRKR